MNLTKIRWTKNALKDLDTIRNYLKTHADEDRMRLEAERIWESCQRLKQFPQSGRAGRIPMTRELVVLPYIIPYRIQKNTVEILNIFHSSQKR